MCIKLVLGMLLFSAGWVYSFTAQELIEIRDGFNARRDAAMEQMRGEPLVIAKKLPPLSPDEAHTHAALPGRSLISR